MKPGMYRTFGDLALAMCAGCVLAVFAMAYLWCGVVWPVVFIGLHLGGLCLFGVSVLVRRK